MRDKIYTRRMVKRGNREGEGVGTERKRGEGDFNQGKWGKGTVNQI